MNQINGSVKPGDLQNKLCLCLAAGVLVAGFLLGSQNNNNGIIPNEWIANLVGGNSLFSISLHRLQVHLCISQL